MVARNKILVLMLALAMVFSSVLALASCDEETGCQHTDLDKDWFCDSCGAEFTDTCLEHVDIDPRDGYCDYCETFFGLSCLHKDADGNGKCDECDERFYCDHKDADGNLKCDDCETPIPCPGHEDKNEDGICDKCQTVLEVINDGIQATLDAYANSTPTKVVTNSTVDFFDYDDTLVYTLVAKSELVTGSIDGLLTTTRVVETDRILSIAEGSNDIILEPYAPTKTTEEFQKGLGRRTNGGGWRADGLNFAPTSRNITLKISSENIVGAKYTEELYNNVITFTVPLDKVDEVFGVDSKGNSNIVTDSAVKVTIVNNGAVVTSVEIEYERISDEDTYPTQVVTMKTEYSYDIQDVKLLY